MPYIVGLAAREHELYTRLKDFMTGVGFIGRAYFTGAGNGRLNDIRCPDLQYSGEVYTLTNVFNSSTFTGAFGVSSSSRGTILDANINGVYVDPRVQFYLEFGDTPFELGDQFVVKFCEYSAPSKPKFSRLDPKKTTVTETVTLVCTQAGVPGIVGVQPSSPAVFSVEGSVSGPGLPLTQGELYNGTAFAAVLARGDENNPGVQYSVGDEIVVHTTQNELIPLGQEWEVLSTSQVPSTVQFGATIPESDSTVIFEGPGLSGDDQVQVSLARSWTNFTATWALSGMRGYAPNLTYNEQPSMLPTTSRPNISFWSGTIPYWISVTGRRVTLKRRSNNAYGDVYLGLGIPWGSPKYQPYFLCVGGENYWTVSTQVLNRSGQWQAHLVGGAGVGWRNTNLPYVYPYQGNGTNLIARNLDGSTPLLPIVMGPDQGELDGVFAATGVGEVQSEDLIWNPDTKRKMVLAYSNVSNLRSQLMAMELL